MDPLSITAGVFSLLSSLAALSMKINDFREDFQGAESEIRDLTEEVNSLGSILKRLEGTCSSISRNLVDDLSKILQNLNTAVVETQLFLSTTLDKKLKGPFWAFTGKKQCGQLCRRLEAYKSTLNITLTFVSIFSVQELHTRGDEILTGIHDIQRVLPGTTTGDKYVLQKYLTELETVYETSTAAEYWEDDARTEVTEVESSTLPSRNSSRRQIPHTSVRKEHTLESLPESLPSSTEDLQDPASIPHPRPLTPQTHPGRPAKTKTTAEHWNSITEPKYIHSIPRGSYSLSASSNSVIARKENFAVWIGSTAELHHGYIFKGTVTQTHQLSSFELRAGDYWPGDGGQGYGCENRRVSYLAFSDDEGSLVAVLSRLRPGLGIEHLIVGWEAGANEWEFKRLSPCLLEDGGFMTTETELPLSPNGRFFAYESKAGVKIFDTDGNRHLASVSAGSLYSKRRLIWSRSCDKLLVFSTPGSPATPQDCVIKIYQTSSEEIIFNATFRDLGFKRIGFFDSFNFNFSGSDNNIDIVRSAFGGASLLPRIRSTPKSVSKLRGGQAFWGSININDRTVSLKHVDKKGEYVYQIPWFSGDGSCVLRYHDWDKNLQLVALDSNSTVRILDLPDITHENIMFDEEGYRIYTVRGWDEINIMIREPKS